MNENLENEKILDEFAEKNITRNITIPQNLRSEINKRIFITEVKKSLKGRWIIGSCAILIFAFIITIAFISPNIINPISSKNEITNVVRNSADYYACNNLQELENESDLILIGIPVNMITDDKQEIKYMADKIHWADYFSMRKVKISKVLKGQYQESQIDVIEHAVTIDNPDGKGKQLITFEDNSIIQKGDKYILFLKKIEDGRYSMIAVQGKCNIDNKDQDEKDTSEKQPLFVNVKKEIQEKYKNDISNELKS